MSTDDSRIEEIAERIFVQTVAIGLATPNATVNEYLAWQQARQAAKSFVYKIEKSSPLVPAVSVG